MYLSEDVKGDMELMVKHSKSLHKIDFSEVHDCEKCHGKMIGITVDLVGVERCGYCNQVVDYKGFFRRKLRELEQSELKRN